jgi:Ni,Fe-hydrogenase III component G
MNTTQALDKARDLLHEWVVECSSPERFRCDFNIPREFFSDVVQALHDGKWGYLCTITGVDRPAKDENGIDHIDVMYHFAEGEAVVTLHVILPYDSLHLPTVCHLIPSASIYEREIMEMLGVTIEGTPDTNKLVLPDNWPDNIFPLRKSFKGLTPDQITEAKS